MIWRKQIQLGMVSWLNSGAAVCLLYKIDSFSNLPWWWWFWTNQEKRQKKNNKVIWSTDKPHRITKRIIQSINFGNSLKCIWNVRNKLSLIAVSPGQKKHTIARELQQQEYNSNDSLNNSRTMTTCKKKEAVIWILRRGNQEFELTVDISDSRNQQQMLKIIRGIRVHGSSNRLSNLGETRKLTKIEANEVKYREMILYVPLRLRWFSCSSQMAQSVVMNSTELKERIREKTVQQS